MRILEGLQGLAFGVVSSITGTSALVSWSLLGFFRMYCVQYNDTVCMYRILFIPFKTIVV